MRTELKVKADENGQMEVTMVDHSAIYTQRNDCRGCHWTELQEVLDLGVQYLCNFVPEVDISLPRAPLTLVRCANCGLLQLKHTVNPDLVFRDYWYRSSVNQSMRDALIDLVQKTEPWAPRSNGIWLDIGANDGFLLSKVPSSFTKIGVEPARTFTRELSQVADHVISDYFGVHSAIQGVDGEGLCDVITSVAMFYDVDDPDMFVADIASVLSPRGIWVNQLNDSPTMLKRNAFDSICHEHLCYYDIHALKALYDRHGLAIVDISHNEVNGGSIRVIATKKRPGTIEVPLLGLKQPTMDDCVRFAQRVRKWKITFTELLRGAMTLHGSVWLYGASTKGCVLLQYLGEDYFVGIADRNPTKLGLKMAGTWLPVRSEEELRAENPAYVVALPWAFRNEFVVRERDLLDRGTTMVFPLPEIQFAL